MVWIGLRRKTEISDRFVGIGPKNWGSRTAIYGEWGAPDGKDKKKDIVYLARLKNHFDPSYRDEIGDVTDQARVDEWQGEFHDFETNGNLPQLNIIHLPNDHTCGTRLGYPTPRAMVADNDLALGRIVETISHSRFWSQSVIFVFEDDAQDGPDHVDAHRSILMIVSPFHPPPRSRARAFSNCFGTQDDEANLGNEQPHLFRRPCGKFTARV